MRKLQMTRRRFATAALGAGAVGALPILARPVLAQAPTALNVRLDWTAWGIHGALYLAQDKGWLSAAGLNVTLQDGNGSASGVQIVGNSTEFDLGHASLSTMMVARSSGLPVKAFSIFFRDGDIGCFVPQDSDIETPADLRGKRIVYTAGSLESPFVGSFLAAGGLTEADVELINVNAASKSGTYASGQADAALSTIPFFLPSIEPLRPSKAIRFADYNLIMPGYGLFTNEAALAGPKREALATYAGIIAATWTYIYSGNQEEAVDSIIANRPQARVPREVLRGQIDALEAFLGTPAEPELPIGAISVPDWDAAVETLSSVDLVSADLPGSDYVDAELFSEADLGALAP